MQVLSKNSEVCPQATMKLLLKQGHSHPMLTTEAFLAQNMHLGLFKFRLLHSHWPK